MKTKLAILSVAIFLGLNAFAQNAAINMVDFNGLKPYLTKQTDTVYVVNFWATWCKPCVEELPTFTKLSKNMMGQKVKFIFVSLDFPKQLESRLKPFVDANLSDQLVVLLNDPNANAWIGKVDAQWSGAIPATLIYKKDQRFFHEGTLSKDDLLKQIALKQ